jgi:hypothetical protein
MKFILWVTSSRSPVWNGYDFDTLEQAKWYKHQWHNDGVKYRIEYNNMIVEEGIC